MLVLGVHKIYGVDSSNFSSQNMKGRQQLLINNMVFKCGVTTRITDRVHLYASVIQTQGILEKPHKVTGLLRIEENESEENEMDVLISEMRCACTAGLGHACKHIVAVLLYCSR